LPDNGRGEPAVVITPVYSTTKSSSNASSSCGLGSPSWARGGIIATRLQGIKQRFPNTLILTATGQASFPRYEGMFQVRCMPGFRFITVTEFDRYESGFMLPLCGDMGTVTISSSRISLWGRRRGGSTLLLRGERGTKS